MEHLYFCKNNRCTASILSAVGFAGSLVTFRTAAVIFVLPGCIQPLWDGGAAAFLLGQGMEQRN